MTKPCGVDELLARIRAALRRTARSDSAPVVHTEAFTIDPAAKQVTTSEGNLRLTPTEWALLEILVLNPGKLVGHKHLLQEVWGLQDFPTFTRNSPTTCCTTPPSAGQR